MARSGIPVLHAFHAWRTTSQTVWSPLRSASGSSVPGRWHTTQNNFLVFIFTFKGNFSRLPLLKALWLVILHDIAFPTFAALLKSCGAVVQQLFGAIRVVFKMMHFPPFMGARLLLLLPILHDYSESGRAGWRLTPPNSPNHPSLSSL